MNINNTTTDRSSFANNQEPKEPLYGKIHEVEEQAVKIYLTEELWIQYIFPLLHYRDIKSVIRVFKCATMAIHNNNIISNSWLSHFTSQQTASFKKCIQKMSRVETHYWMCQFAMKKSMTIFIEERATADYAESFIFKRALSMRTCLIFKVEDKCTINHDAINSATFSADSLHVVTASDAGTARIYGQDSCGEWVLKTIIDHHSGCIVSATFSADDSHVITLSNTQNAKIYGQDSKGEWMEKAIECPQLRFLSATFSADSLHAMLVSKIGTVQIYGRDLNGEWTQRTIIDNDAECTTAIFSPDSRNVLITPITRERESHKSTNRILQAIDGRRKPHLNLIKRPY